MYKAQDQKLTISAFHYTLHIISCIVSLTNALMWQHTHELVGYQCTRMWAFQSCHMQHSWCLHKIIPYTVCSQTKQCFSYWSFALSISTKAVSNYTRWVYFFMSFAFILSYILGTIYIFWKIISTTYGWHTVKPKSLRVVDTPVLSFIPTSCAPKLVLDHLYPTA